MKTYKTLIAVALLGCLALTGCASGSNNQGNVPGSFGNDSENSSNLQGGNSNPSDQSNHSGGNHSFGYPSETPSQNPSQNGGRQPGENQVWDYANGFGLNELESALRSTGAITTTGVPYDVNGTNMKSAMRYGNIVIGTYQEELVDEALALYQKGSMTINGKEVKVVNMIGNFLLIVLDGELDQASIAAFSAVGGL